MKAPFILALLLLGGLALPAQTESLEVVANSGGHHDHPDAQLSWTLGELSIATLDDPQATLTQGFHQTSIVVTAMETAFPEAWDVSTFPNPASERLHVRWNESSQPVHLRFSNLNGQVLYQGRVEAASETEIPVTAYPQGTYLLEVFDASGQQGKTFKIEVIRR